MPKMIDDKQMNRADCEFIFSGNNMAGKWMGIDQCCAISSEGIKGFKDQVFGSLS